MVSTQQEATLFLKSNTEKMTTPSEHPVHHIIEYPHVVMQQLTFNACLLNKGIKGFIHIQIFFILTI